MNHWRLDCVPKCGACTTGGPCADFTKHTDHFFNNCVFFQLNYVDFVVIPYFIEVRSVFHLWNNIKFYFKQIYQIQYHL